MKRSRALRCRGCFLGAGIEGVVANPDVDMELALGWSLWSSHFSPLQITLGGSGITRWDECLALGMGGE